MYCIGVVDQFEVTPQIQYVILDLCSNKKQTFNGAVNKKYLYTHVTLTNMQDSVTKLQAEEVRGQIVYDN